MIIPQFQLETKQYYLIIIIIDIAVNINHIESKKQINK